MPAFVSLWVEFLCLFSLESCPWEKISVMWIQEFFFISLAPGALAVLMMDALPPNTMQTLEGTPALVHVPSSDYLDFVAFPSAFRPLHFIAIDVMKIPRSLRRDLLRTSLMETPPSSQPLCQKLSNGPSVWFRLKNGTVNTLKTTRTHRNLFAAIWPIATDDNEESLQQPNPGIPFESFCVRSVWI